MAIEWNETFSTGLDWQDSQHKELFGRVNAFTSALAQGKASEEIRKVTDFLAGYVVEHFGNEERWMEKNSYPELAAHREAHKKLLSEFGALKSEFETKGITTMAAMKAQRWLEDWLINHIGKVDKAMGVFGKAKGLGA